MFTQNENYDPVLIAKSVEVEVTVFWVTFINPVILQSWKLKQGVALNTKLVNVRRIEGKISWV